MMGGGGNIVGIVLNGGYLVKITVGAVVVVVVVTVVRLVGLTVATHATTVDGVVTCVVGVGDGRVVAVVVLEGVVGSLVTTRTETLSSSSSTR
jgi:hypothetical protein